MNAIKYGGKGSQADKINLAAMGTTLFCKGYMGTTLFCKWVQLYFLGLILYLSGIMIILYRQLYFKDRSRGVRHNCDICVFFDVCLFRNKPCLSKP